MGASSPCTPHPHPRPHPALGPQLFLSQAPNLESVAGASAVGAIMSLLYTGIALVLCFSAVRCALCPRSLTKTPAELRWGKVAVPSPLALAAARP